MLDHKCSENALFSGMIEYYRMVTENLAVEKPVENVE